MANATKIDLVYFNAGGGHRSAALALQTVIRDLELPWQVRLVNLFEVLDPQDAFRRATGMGPEDIYNRRLARGWTFGLAQELKILQGMIRLSHRLLTRTLQRHWQRTRPDLVVSLVPNFNRAMYQSLAAALPGVPYVTILTDLADYPPHFWIERSQPQHFICGTPRAVQQARALGHAPEQIHATSGMIIRPEFYRATKLDRDAELRRHGLSPDRPTGLVMFGAQGSRAMLDIATQLHDTQLILIAGHNRLLAARLRALPAAAPRLILGFTPDIQYYMQLSDFFIGKPGPGSLSEAVQQQLPVIVVHNSLTMPQERYNPQWVRDNQVGIVLRSFSDIRAAVDEVTARLVELRANTRHIDNRAVYEIPVILESILESAQPAWPIVSTLHQAPARLC